MIESGGNDGFEGDEVSLLAEELIQLSVKSSMVEPNEKPTVICTIWTEKSYNLDSFKAQMKSIWKTKKKFEIQSVRQNLFMIVFELEEDLETIMEGQPWLFRKSLVIFDRLTNPMERDQIRLVSSLFWIKIGQCLPEFDKKDLLHAIGVTFRGVLRSKINGEFCRLRIKLNVQKPLRRLGHDIQECTIVEPAEKDKIREDPPFSLALKVELNLVRRESLKFNALAKKLQPQCSYTGGVKESQEMYLHNGKSSGMIQEVQEDSWVTITEKETGTQKEGEINGNNSARGKTEEDLIKPVRKISWKTGESVGVMKYHEAESKLQKRKLTEIEYDDYNTKETREDAAKKRRCDGQTLINEAETNLLIENPTQNRSAAAKRQADRTQ
ncbi:hypothetical protein Goshw_016057 [Gossypium schwendimanii]|uniref:DUF4283 domain-containing protein n=1 Tax=Gossypium schwendimanii TaxID=34291 RepID=A0A7J9N0N7_GOSSC|nr:hypothetical protein [Gossypium schwendimanii]